MNRTFLFGSVALVVGAAAGLAYRGYLTGQDVCDGVFGVGSGVEACTPADGWLAFLNVAALVTLVLSLLYGLFAAVRKTDDGFVGIGDAFVVVGGFVALVEVAVYAMMGTYLGLAWGSLRIALVVFAVKQERQTAMAVALVMGVCACSWAVSDPSALLQGLAPGLFWIAAGAAYAGSLKVGEPV